MAARLKVAPKPRADEVGDAPVSVVAAVKALHDGTALPHQQQLALQWIVREACGKAHFPYHQNDRDTAFALGRVFVADVLIGMFNADLSSLRVNHVQSQVPASEA